MLVKKEGVDNVLVHPSDLGRAALLLREKIEAHFGACSKKVFDLVSIDIRDFDIVVNNAGSECVAKCAYTAVVHSPAEGDVVCGSCEVVENYLVVHVSDHFKVFVKHPTDLGAPRAHVRLTRIKSQMSDSIIALGEQAERAPAVLCRCAV